MQYVSSEISLHVGNKPYLYAVCLQRRQASIFPAHWPRSLQRLGTPTTLLGDEIFLTTLSSARFLRFFSEEAGPSPSLSLWTIPTSLTRSQPSLTDSYLCRIKRKESSSCSVCGHPLQDLTHLLLDCPASEALRHAIFGTTNIFDLCSRP